MDILKDHHKVTSSLDFKKQMQEWFPLLDLGQAYPLYVKIYTEKEMNSISRRMQEFYFGHILRQIIEWNIETGYFCYEGTETTIVDKDVMDGFLRSKFYSVQVKTSKVVESIPKTLKMNKANRKEVCEYFEAIIQTFAKLGCLIESRDLNDIKSLIGDK